jgi:hypothetical protein
MDDRILRQVKYVKERSPLKLPLSKQTADELLWTKYWDWKYEQEWRSWLQLDERENGHYFYHFGTQSNFYASTRSYCCCYGSTVTVNKKGA